MIQLMKFVVNPVASVTAIAIGAIGYMLRVGAIVARTNRVPLEILRHRWTVIFDHAR